jgi:hypothetical protein
MVVKKTKPKKVKIKKAMLKVVDGVVVLVEEVSTPMSSIQIQERIDGFTSLVEIHNKQIDLLQTQLKEVQKLEATLKKK